MGAYAPIKIARAPGPMAVALDSNVALTNADAAVPLATQLREGTKKSHTMAENTGFVSCFLKGVVDKLSYRKLVASLYFVYAAMEEEIDRLRHAATSALLTRHDTIVVASVSCIYGLGNPIEYKNHMLLLEVGMIVDQRELLRRFVDMQYHRNDLVVERGSFRVRGDTIEIQPAYDQEAIRLSLFGDEVEAISFFNPLTMESKGAVTEVTLFAATHYATSSETLSNAMHRIRAELAIRL
ncbi:MAG: hypothetical protein EBY27_07495, partial [Synechococcaceae bacterium WB8_3_299]|nr:hypothetical protein [Synechococcaceae bacterium WB8_3_299]